MSRSALARWSVFAFLAALAASSYAPGLHGAFLFDDFANLPSLGATGPIRDLPSFWRYVTSGSADPLGRPLSLLSFLLDARDWPADPYPFKRTNLGLHLLDGLLLWQLLRALGRRMSPGNGRPDGRARIEWAALLAAGMWLLHPLFVSTTLYVVQREAMLPALFTLAGLLLWLRGRQACADGRPARGLAWLLLGLGGCTVLATLSKANGLLLPALALTLEFTLPIPPDRWCDPRARRLYSKAMAAMAVVPAGVIGIYLLYQGWIGLSHGLSGIRPWSLGQRLMTEPRILLDYLGLLWLPRPFTPGLFNDHIRASVSLLSPATTLPALLAIVVLVTGALLARRRLPALAAAVLFYFVGQSIESSTIPLELYYEHRNYLPALLAFWPFALWLCDVPQTGAPCDLADLPRRPSGHLKIVLAVIVLAGLAAMTYARASLWGNTQDQALLWAKLNPGSPRAQANAAQAEMIAGHPELAVRRLRPALQRAPDESQLALNLLAARCQLGNLDPETLRAAARALRTTRDTGTLLASWFQRAIDQAAAAPCPQLDLDAIDGLIRAALANPRLTDQAGRRQDLYYLQGYLALARHQPDVALARFEHALDQQVRATAAFQQAALLGSAGYPSHGLALLDHYQAEQDQEALAAFGMPRVHAWVLTRQGYWQAELARLRNTLVADQRAKDSLTR